MKGRYAIVMNTAPVDRPAFVFWQRGFGDPYIFDTRAEAIRIFKERCEADGFKGQAGQFQYWVVDLNEGSAHIHGGEAPTLKLA